MVMKKRIKNTEEAANSIFHLKNYFVTESDKDNNLELAR